MVYLSKMVIFHGELLVITRWYHHHHNHHDRFFYFRSQKPIEIRWFLQQDINSLESHCLSDGSLRRCEAHGLELGEVLEPSTPRHENL